MLPDIERFLSIFICLLFFVLGAYDILLILAAFLRRKEETYAPMVYVLTMSICGFVSKFFIVLTIFLSFNSQTDLYNLYLEFIGQYATVIHQLSMNIPYCICALMTIHRVAIVWNYNFQLYFLESHLLTYLVFLAIPILLLTISPWIFDDCETVFSLETLNFESQCVNAYLTDKLVFISVICIIINFFIFLHIFLKKHGVYETIRKISGQSQVHKPFVIDAVPPPVRLARVRRFTAMRQMAISTAALMVFCEWEYVFKPFLTTAELSPDIRQLLGYFHLICIGFFNFLVFGVMTEASKKLVREMFSGPHGPYIHNNIIHVA